MMTLVMSYTKLLSGFPKLDSNTWIVHSINNQTLVKPLAQRTT